MLKRLRHPGIAQLVNVYESQDYVHLVFEYTKTVPILSILKKKPNYSEADAVRVMRSLLETVAHMHSKHVIYRSIRPENVFLT